MLIASQRAQAFQQGYYQVLTKVAELTYDDVVPNAVAGALAGGVLGGGLTGLTASAFELAREEEEKDFLKHVLLPTAYGTGLGALGGGILLGGLGAALPPLHERVPPWMRDEVIPKDQLEKGEAGEHKYRVLPSPSPTLRERERGSRDKDRDIV